MPVGSGPAGNGRRAPGCCQWCAPLKNSSGPFCGRFPNSLPLIIPRRRNRWQLQGLALVGEGERVGEMSKTGVAVAKCCGSRSGAHRGKAATIGVAAAARHSERDKIYRPSAPTRKIYEKTLASRKECRRNTSANLFPFVIALLMRVEGNRKSPSEEEAENRGRRDLLPPERLTAVSPGTALRFAREMEAISEFDGVVSFSAIDGN